MNRIPKLVLNAEEGQRKLKKGIETLTDAVKSTLGPDGQTVVIEGDNFVGGYTVTKDGVTVANSISLFDSVENQGAQILKEAAKSTYTSAGDGTTTSIVLTQGMINSFDQVYHQGVSKIELIRTLGNMTKLMIDSVDSFTMNIDKLSKEEKRQQLFNIATISANNDPEIGEMISDLFMKTENVSIENSKNNTTYSDFIDGIVLDKGYISSQFINDEKNNTCVLENPFILFCDVQIYDLLSLEQVLKHAALNNRPILLIGNFKPNVLNAFIKNVTHPQGQFRGAMIAPPSFGERSKEIMGDLADVLGGFYVNETTGDNSQTIIPEGLAQARRVVIRDNRTIIYPLDHQIEKINIKISELKAFQSSDVTNERLEGRIKTLSASIGIIHVGSDSNSETNEKKDRIDDSVRSVYSAITGGVIPGGGKTLINIYKKVYDSIKNPTELEEMALEILGKVSLVPLQQMLTNAGFLDDDIKSIVTKVSNSKKEEGYNIKKREFTNLISSGVIDPAIVLKSCLKNSISVASTILNTGCVVTSINEYNIPNQA